MKLYIKNTQHGLYDEYGDVEIVLRISLIDNERSGGVVAFLVSYEHSTSI